MRDPSYIPKPTRHRSGQAVVRLNGRDFYLGKFGSPAARGEYERLIAEWLANGRRTPRDELTVNDLILGFLEHAVAYYKKAGDKSGEIGGIKDALKIVKRLHGRNPAVEFGPKALNAVRTEMIKAGWCRKDINHQIDRVRRMFRWATEEELVPGTVYHALKAVKGIRKGAPGVRGKRPPGDVYTTASYRRAIHRACREANIEKWSPNQFRHTAANWTVSIPPTPSLASISRKTRKVGFVRLKTGVELRGGRCPRAARCRPVGATPRRLYQSAGLALPSSPALEALRPLSDRASPFLHRCARRPGAVDRFGSGPGIPVSSNDHEVTEPKAVGDGTRCHQNRFRFFPSRPSTGRSSHPRGSADSRSRIADIARSIPAPNSGASASAATSASSRPC